MAKCVVCSKSAGPFHSLHKACLSAYQGTRGCLREKLSEYIAAEEFSINIIETLAACKPSEKFSELQFKELFIKAWQEEAKLAVKNSSPNLLTAKKLVHLAEGFGLSDEEVDEYLLTRLSCVEHFDRLKNNKPLDVKFDLPSGIQLGASEVIVWKFKPTAKQEQQRFSQEKKWTVFSSVSSSILMKKRYKELAVKHEESGILLVTNQGLHYQYKNAVAQTKYSEIHSITPMKNGVRVQANTSGAMPDTYVTGDGRFTYALLRYAQELKL